MSINELWERSNTSVNELVVASTPDFVAPHYIEELGCAGLTAEEIAQSLGAHVDTVRRKLREHPNETLKSLKLLIGRMVNINGVEYEEFFLSTAAAKFFVARYESESGDGYLAYLLGVEVAYDKIIAFLKANKLTCEDLVSRLKVGHTIALENEQLKKEREELEKEGDELVSPEELALLDRTMTSRLRIFGRVNQKHRKAFVMEVVNKFYKPGEEEGYHYGLQRKNWKHALEYIKSRTWSLMEGY